MDQNQEEHPTVEVSTNKLAKWLTIAPTNDKVYDDYVKSGYAQLYFCYDKDNGGRYCGITTTSELVLLICHGWLA